MHYRNIQALAIQLYKVHSVMSLVIMNEIFQFREESHQNLRYTSKIVIPSIHGVYYGSQSALYLGRKFWDLIPPVIQQVEPFDGYKKEIKKMETI